MGSSPPAAKPEASSNLAVLDEGSVIEFGDGLTQFVLRIHHDRTVPGDGLFEWPAGNQ
jgi:hypothetical protein